MLNKLAIFLFLDPKWVPIIRRVILCWVLGMIIAYVIWSVVALDIAWFFVKDAFLARFFYLVIGTFIGSIVAGTSVVKLNESLEKRGPR